MAKIVELIQSGKYDELKSVLEEKLANKIKEKIEEKKTNFIEKVKKSKKPCEKATSSSSSKE